MMSNGGVIISAVTMYGRTIGLFRLYEEGNISIDGERGPFGKELYAAMMEGHVVGLTIVPTDVSVESKENKYVIREIERAGEQFKKRIRQLVSTQNQKKNRALRRADEAVKWAMLAVEGGGQ